MKRIRKMSPSNEIPRPSIKVKFGEKRCLIEKDKNKLTSPTTIQKKDKKIVQEHIRESCDEGEKRKRIIDKKFVYYGALAIGMGTIISQMYSSYKTVGVVIASATIGIALTLGSMIYRKVTGKKENLFGKMGQAITLDRVAAEIFLPPTILGTASYLANSVQGPVSGLFVGGVSMLSGFLVHAIVFYGGWGLLNIRKYASTGFGKLRDLQEFPKQIKKTVEKLVKGKAGGKEKTDEEGVNAESEEVIAESYLFEIAQMCGKGIVCTTPYFAIRLISGFIAGLEPNYYMGTFVVITTAASPWVFPIYMKFYELIEQRLNSAVDSISCDSAYGKE